MNKAETADRRAVSTGLSKAVAKETVDGLFGVFGEVLANGEDVRIAGFGTFGTRSRRTCTGRNPRTGKTVSMSPSLKGGKTLKDAVIARTGS